MSGVHDDLATLRRAFTPGSPIYNGSVRIGDVVDRVEAEIARLREESEENFSALMDERDKAVAAEERCARLQQALDWYADHKRDDGSYDGEMWGDLQALAGLDTPADSRSPFPRPALQSGEAGLFGHEHYPGAPADSQTEDGTA